MIDADGREAFFDRYSVPRETQKKLDRYVELLLAENQTQNLIAKSTEAEVWTRHLLDSAQLTELIPAGAKTLLDVGSGAGLPGIVLALMTDLHCTLVEPRRLRARFLGEVRETLGLSSSSVTCDKIEKFGSAPFDVITARAFAPLARTLDGTRHLANDATTWLLLKGRSAAEEVEAAVKQWHASFDLVPSLSAPDASVVRVSALQGPRR